jgi:hypothetical protein
VYSTGNKNEEVKFTQPGLYYYEVNVSGNYKGRKYPGNAKISIRITEDGQVKVED